MYLDKDYYLCDHRKNFKSDKEIIDFIKEVFPGVREIEVQGSVCLYLFSFLGYVLYPFGINAITAHLGSYIGTPQVRRRLSRYASNGLLRNYSFSVRDMDCRNAYYVPANRHNEISATLPPFLKSSLKLRRCGGKVPGHDYGVGISILQYMLLGKQFEVLKEVTYASTERKSRGSLCVDAVIRFLNCNYNIYLEQDMGTESHFELVNKLYLYKKHGLTRGRAYVVFSSHELCEYPKCITFSKKDMEKLYIAFQEEEVHSLSEYERYYLEDANEDIKDLFIRLAVRVGYYVATKKGDKSKRLDAAEIDSDSVLELNNRGWDFSIEEFRRYIDELFDGTNPYRQRIYNMEQIKHTLRKFRGLCEYICSYIHKGYFQAGEVEAVINDGLGCLVYPTVLLSRSYNYMELRFWRLIEGVLKKYYVGLEDSTYSHMSPYIDMEGNIPHCLFHNCFTMENGSYLCVEHIGYDVGAFCRFYYMYLYYERIEVPLHLVALVENEDEMLYFARLSGFCIESETVDMEAPFFLSFLNLRDFKRQLSGVYKDGDGYRTGYLSVLVEDDEDEE